MDLTLQKYISSRQEKGEGNYTHISQIQPTGKFNITRKDDEEFWTTYCDLLQNNPDMVSGLAEKPMDYMPVFNDTDLKTDYDSDKHSLTKKLYKETHIKQTAMIYQKYFKQIIKDYKPKHGICFVLEKEVPTLDKESIKHGFHLHFINTVMHKIDQDIHLIPRIRKEVDDKNLFADIGIKSSINAIDKSCTSKHWLLYGSRKNKNLQSYRVTKIFNDECDEISLEEALQDFKLTDVHGDEIQMDKTKLEYYLPRILSIHPETREPVSVKTDLNIITKKILKKAKESKKVFEGVPVPEALKTAKELMKLISVSRTENYDDWLDIGWILFNIGDGSEEAFDIWVDFSSKTTKKNYFSEKSCMYYWERMEKKNKTIGSLYHYAKQDSPEEYKKIQKKESDKLFNESLNGGHYDMAKWLHNKYRDEFVCACIEKDAWFQYVNHKWVINKKGISLRKKISTELVEAYKNLKKKICEEMAEEDDDAELQKRLKTVNKIIASLKSSPFKKNIMTEAQELFFLDGFVERLDSNPDLLHFTNGVLDLTEMRLRDGRPSDYLSLTTGYDFVDHSPDDVEVIECEDHLSKVFPDPMLKKYFMEYSASLLRGGNSQKTFLNQSGEGDNAKSINMDLMRLALGKYMKILPTALIVGKRTQSAQATPELCGIQGVRFAILQEPNSKDVINIGILKELSGNDIIYIRGLFKDSQEVRPMFKLSLICNKLPRLPCDDPATWNRIRVLLYESCFPNDKRTIPDTFEEQVKVKRFPRDPFFSEKLPKLKTAFMWLMFENFKRIQKEGRMPEPERVQEATDIYRKNNDIFLQFISEKIVEDTENPKAIMSVVETYNSFRTWFNESYPNLQGKIPSKEEMKDELIRKWGELNKSHKWKGYRLRTPEDDERDGAAIIIREEDLAVEKEEEKVEKVERLLNHKNKKVVSNNVEIEDGDIEGEEINDTKSDVEIIEEESDIEEGESSDSSDDETKSTPLIGNRKK
jgi:phage/plasmid-associated DNA primase